jgi:uncharacterized Fe-S cluster protein YjdI
MEKETTIKYKANDITIVWKPKVCIHSKLYWKELGEVFKPAEKPWVKVDGASTDKIKAQIDKCPSGALSYFSTSDETTSSEIMAESIVEVIVNGPLLVYGNITVKKEGEENCAKNKVTAFCRCGHSANKPYCDGTHTKMDFKG